MNRNVPLAAKTPLARSPLLPGSSSLPRTGWRIRNNGIRPVSAESTQAAPRRRTASSGRRESFPPAVAALIDARDPWCVHCGTPFGLQRHHRRIKGHGGDSRPHTDCACNGVRICLECHDWAHSGNGRAEADTEGLIIPRATVAPWTLGVLVHLEENHGGLLKYPSCDGRWADSPDEVAA